MRILIAEDDPISRRMLQVMLEKSGYEVVATQDGLETWRVLQREDTPRLAILDWMMPGIDGVEICRRVRQTPAIRSLYLILLTAKGNLDDIVTGLEAGADDYITKPFRGPELRARVRVGMRVLELQESLQQRVQELEAAIQQIRKLEEILPICSYCHRIRNDENYWQQVDQYLTEHAGTQFSHSICPECYQKYVVPELEKLAGMSREGKDDASHPHRGGQPHAASSNPASAPEEGVRSSDRPRRQGGTPDGHSRDA